MSEYKASLYYLMENFLLSSMEIFIGYLQMIYSS